MARSTREHSNGLPWNTLCNHFLDKAQKHAVLDPYPKEVGLDKSRRAEGGAEEADAVVVKPMPVAIKIRIVR